ncbi:MAG TPA: MFS transporter [Azospirillaceae bacterium]|nr:MFS transporter [Azospirillaceae bacterium]
MASAAWQDDDFPGGRYAWYVVFVFILCVLFSFVDRQILSLLVEPIQRDLGLTDTQFGILQGFSFSFLHAVVSLPLGWLADHRNRRNLLMAGVAAWALATGLCAVAQSYEQLLVLRICVGIGEATVVPVVYSMIADYFPPRQRITANVVYHIGALIGASLALALGGLLVDLLGRSAAACGWALCGWAPWRLSFLVVSLPGPLICLLLLTVREPPRRERAAQAAGSAAATWTFLRDRWKPIGSVILAIAVGGFSVNIVATWFPAVLVRVHGWDIATAGVWFGVMLGVSSISGAALSAPLGAWALRRHGIPGLVLVMAGASAFALLVASLAVFIRSGGDAVANVGLQFFGMFVISGLTASLLQGLAPNEFRGQVAALNQLVGAVFLGIGPVMVGYLSDRLDPARADLGDIFSGTIWLGLVLTTLLFWVAVRLNRAAARPVAA